jgi:hypothetical protein
MKISVTSRRCWAQALLEGMPMERTFLMYCRVAAVVFLLNTIYPVVVKSLQGRLADDWLHSALHLASALAAIYAGWLATGLTAARVYTWAIGLVYLGLSLYGWLTPGFLLGTTFAVPLGPADNIFHLLLSIPALTIAALEVRSSL